MASGVDRETAQKEEFKYHYETILAAQAEAFAAQKNEWLKKNLEKLEILQQKTRPRKGVAAGAKPMTRKQMKNQKFGKINEEALRRAQEAVDNPAELMRAECKFWLNGACNKAEECPHLHVGLPMKKKELCQHHIKGSCRKVEASPPTNSI